jgi:hypothetical protein
VNGIALTLAAPFTVLRLHPLRARALGRRHRVARVHHKVVIARPCHDGRVGRTGITDMEPMPPLRDRIADLAMLAEWILPRLLALPAGNVSKAAQVSGLARSWVRLMKKKYGL